MIEGLSPENRALIKRVLGLDLHGWVGNVPQLSQGYLQRLLDAARNEGPSNPAGGEGLREEIARIIDPLAFGGHKAPDTWLQDRVLAKADAILALCSTIPPVEVGEGSAGSSTEGTI